MDDADSKKDSVDPEMELASVSHDIGSNRRDGLGRTQGEKMASAGGEIELSGAT